jgi:hypothetical protein
MSSRDGKTVAKTAVCAACGTAFDSKGKLFRHLRDTAGSCSIMAPVKPKAEKTVFLLGYIGTDYIGEGCQWSREVEMTHAKSNRRDSRAPAEKRLFEAIEASAIDSTSALDGFSRASRTDKGCHAVCNMLCVNAGAATEKRNEACVQQMNDCLPANIRVFGRYSGCYFASLHAASSSYHALL